MLSEAEIERLARAAMEANKGVPGNYLNGNELVCRMTGIRAEAEFADMYRLPFDTRRYTERGSDGGFDFKVTFHNGKYSLSFDVKCRDGHWDDLLIQENKFRYGRLADYVVLARYHNKKTEWLGWEDPKIVRAMPFAKERLPVPTHLRYRDELRPMQELTYLMQLHDGYARRA